MKATQTVDVLCIAPHPDDAELCSGGLLLKAKQAGLRVGIVDCTRGEMATRGTVAIRKKEAAAADKLIGTDIRINLGLRDGGLRDDDSLREPLVNALRRFRPRIVLAPHWEDQHPDHSAVGRAIEPAAWLCGAPKYAPRSAKGVAAPGRLPFRPQLILHYNNRYGINADLVVDISDVMDGKLALANCYASQFGSGYDKRKGKKKEPQTRLSSEEFVRWFHAMHAQYGFKIGVDFGEAYCVKSPVPIKSVLAFLG